MSRVWNPPNRFESSALEYDEGEAPVARIEVIEDVSRSILTENASPDVSFRWSANPYRGCSHACAYCFARPYHEYLGLGAGTDWERKILVKRDAPRLLAEAFDRPSWKGEMVHFSGITDCYQPLERKLLLTRGCLEVAVRYRNPVGVITRSPLVSRDADLLSELARHNASRVTFSIPILDPELCRKIEPGAPPPSARLRAMRELAEAGVPVGVSVSPMIPGITDRLVPEILQRSREAGATWAFMAMLRLPGAVAPVFVERIRAALTPEKAEAVLRRVREMRGGKLNDSTFHVRGTGLGESWDATQRLFEIWHQKLGFEDRPYCPAVTPFRRPTPTKGGQLAMF
jgi:DNA repair photolyase